MRGNNSVDTVEVLLRYLKKKGYINGNIETIRKDVITGKTTLKKPTDLFIRDQLFGLGTILFEDLTNHYYITTVKLGLFCNILAQAIIMRKDAEAEIAAYAHKGLISGNYAQKAIDKLRMTLGEKDG